MKTISHILILLFLALNLHASTSEQAAYKIAKTVVPPEQQKQVLSFYGKGTPTEILTWYIKFFDPSAKSNARVVVVENGKVERFNTAEGQADNKEIVSFDPTGLNAGVDKALKTASKYAKDSLIPVDSTRVFLNRPSVGKPPVWTVELWHENRQQGYIYANTKDGAFAGYRPPGAGNQSGSAERRHTEKSEREESGKSFGDEVKDTFLGIGGDLEEFFTGERTVDQD